jgi:Flp pilus assembly protein TadB
VIAGALIGALMVGVFGAAYALIGGRRAPRPLSDALLQERIDQSRSAMAGFALRSADQLISRKTRMELGSRLTIAGMSIRPAEWRVLQVIAAFLAGLVGYIFGGILLAPVAAGAGLLITSLVLRLRISAARRRFEEDLPDLLQLLSSSLRSGLTLASALDVVVSDGRQPMVGEIRRVLSRSRLGEPIEVGFGEVADRMKSQDFEWVALAVQIQREVGGNLAEILRTTAETVRQRSYLKRQVRTLSAEGRLSAYILVVLPFVVAGWVSVVNPDYIRPLWTTLPGLLMCLVGGGLMAVGCFWMRAIVRIQP